MALAQRLTRLVVGLSLAVGTGGTTATVLAATGAPTAAHASGIGGTITRSEVLDRAQYWVNQGVVYGTAYDSNGNVTSTRSAPDPNGKAYRTDCSGLVSMAWHLGQSYTTSDFHSWSGVSRLSGSTQLKPGDAVLFDGHVELFARWKSADHTAGAWSYSLNGPIDDDWAKGPVANSHGQVGTLSYSDITSNILLRYDNIVDDPAARNKAANPSDISGDGAGDLLATKADGTLWYYPNNSSTNPGHAFFTTGTQIGTAWDTFDTTLAADVTGDGAADLLATKADGTLWYYPNDSASNPGHKPFTTGTQIGTGWKDFTHITAADVSGDGAADLLATKADGTLWYYPNNSSTNPGHAFFTTGTQIGTGWKDFTSVQAADVSGDGAADLLATKTDGTLWYYPNNSSTNPGHAFFTTGTQIGTGWNGFRIVIAADVSGDGSSDVVAVKPDGALWYYPNDSASNPGHEPFTTGTQIGTGWNGFVNVL